MQNYSQNYRPSGSRLGDRVIRIPRVTPWHISIPPARRRRPAGVSLWMLIYGFAGVILAGAILLSIPISSNAGHWTSFIDSLFTSTSSVGVTGLVLLDTLDHWSLFGQFIIMLLIQFGGLGFMASTTILLMAAGRRIGLRDRILIGESIGVVRLGGIVNLIRNLVMFTIIAEGLGAIIFFARFSSEYVWYTALWKSIFQAVSAFNNAGFDLFGGFKSLTLYSTDYVVLLTTAGLIILGGISFVVISNIYRSRGLSRSTVDTKLVLLITFILLVLGTLVVLVAEYNNPQTLGTMSIPNKVLNAFFQSVTSRTAGFNAIGIGVMSVYTIFFVMLLMFIGGAAGSTAGGIKVNTLGLIMATIWNTIRGREYPGAFGREFPIQQVFRGITLLVLSLVVIIVVFLILSVTENFPSVNILFETVSAFGNVGLTTGITPDLTTIGRIVIIITMFIGRLGPLTLTMALARAQHPTIYHYPKEIVRIG